MRSNNPYPHRPETLNLDRAKTTGIDARKEDSISNTDLFTSVDSREFSRRSKSTFQADRGIHLETIVLDMMDGKRPGRSFLRALSYLYRVGVAARNFAYDMKLLPTAAAPIPVVSIGNIVAGGTGKTPLVKLLAEELSKKMRIAILSRGYRSEVEATGEIIKITPEESVHRCGDEPFWLARELPKVDVWVGKNRSISATLAAQSGAEAIILDDGMQYRQLKRDFEIIVVDGDDPLGKGFFLPRGMLRDTPKRLKKADLIVVGQAKHHTAVKEKLKEFTEAPIVFVKMRCRADLKGKKVGIFCAIGRPERFMEAIRSCGAEVVAAFYKPDHNPFSSEELTAFAKRSGADLLVCTEKDHVKLPHNFSCQLPVMPIEGMLEIISGEAEWQKLIEKVKMYERRI